MLKALFQVTKHTLNKIINEQFQILLKIVKFSQIQVIYFLLPNKLINEMVYSLTCAQGWRIAAFITFNGSTTELHRILRLSVISTKKSYCYNIAKVYNILAKVCMTCVSCFTIYAPSHIYWDLLTDHKDWGLPNDITTMRSFNFLYIFKPVDVIKNV